MNDSGKHRRTPLPRALWVLSAISLFADLSGEMAYPLLPMFVTGVLGASPVALGLIEGVADAIVSMVRGLSGYSSDLSGHRVRWLRRGYALACIGKWIITFATGWGGVFCGRMLDRVGKGIRGAPRDALIAEIVVPEDRGRAFGLHRGIDSLGGVGGSLIAAAVIAWMIGSRSVTPADASDFRIILGVAASTALIAWGLTFFIARSTPQRVQTRREAHAKGGKRPFGRACWVAMAALVLFALGNSSDTFLLLLALDRGASPVESILMYATLSAAYALASYPMGWLSDRYGRWPVLGTGWVVFAISYGGFAIVGSDSPGGLWALFALYGISVACTEGTSRAMIVDYAPKERVATVLGVYGCLQGCAVLISNLAAGWLWSIGQQHVVFWIGSAFAVTALGVLPWMPKSQR